MFDENKLYNKLSEEVKELIAKLKKDLLAKYKGQVLNYRKIRKD